MEIIKRKDGLRYRPSYYLGPKKINGPYFRRKTDAITWKTRMEAEKLSRLALGDQFIFKDDINFKAYAEQWLESHIKVNCVPKTYESYESILRKHIFPVFEKSSMKDLTTERCRQFMTTLKSSRGAKGVENIWIVFRAILIKAKKERVIRDYPLDDISLPKPDLKEDTFWIKDEVNQFLLLNKEDVLYPFYFVAIHTGLRLAELCGLKWDRVDFARNFITVTRTRDKSGLKETTKTKLKRIVPMTPEVRALLLKLFMQGNENRFVFLEKDGSEVSYGHVYRRFRKAQKKAGISRLIRFHDLRHSFASNFMMNGGNVFDLQKLLGHTDIKMTMRYAHLTPDHLQESLKFMGIATIPDSDLKRDNGSQNVRMLS